MSFSSVFCTFFVFLYCYAAAQIFATACRFASAVFFAAAVLNFILAAAVLVFFTVTAHTQWNVIVAISEFVSAPSFYSLEFSFSLFSASLSSLFRLMQHGKSPSTCLSFCLPPPSPFLLSSLWSLCVSVQNPTARIVVHHSSTSDSKS